MPDMQRPGRIGADILHEHSPSLPHLAVAIPLALRFNLAQNIHPELSLDRQIQKPGRAISARLNNASRCSM